MRRGATRGNSPPPRLCAEGVYSLRGSISGQTIWVLGSGPSADSFPRGELKGRLAITLNGAMVLAPTSRFWLFGDPKFARWGACKIASIFRGESVVCNSRHFKWVQNYSSRYQGRRIHTFTNEPSDARRLFEKSDHWLSNSSPEDDFLPGRWTVATIALSFCSLLGAARVVLVGIDLGAPGGRYYASGLSSIPPRKQNDYMGEWRKWVQRGFGADLWPPDVLTTSPHFSANCPGTPVRTISVEEALELG
jgi:hypothetical protein